MPYRNDPLLRADRLVAAAAAVGWPVSPLRCRRRCLSAARQLDFAVDDIQALMRVANTDSDSVRIEAPSRTPTVQLTGRYKTRPAHTSLRFTNQSTNTSHSGLVSESLRARSKAAAEDKSIIVASTTSTLDPGLFGYLLPTFKDKASIDVKVGAQGTCQALDTARRGDADVVFVHAKSAEKKFLSEDFGVKRHPVMYNDLY